MASPHGWTVDTLEKYMSDQIVALKDQIAHQNEQNLERFGFAKEQVMLALAAAEKAIIKAETANDKRFEGVNEFRGTLADQAALLMPRAECIAQHQSIVDKVTDLATRVSKIETSALTRTETRGTNISVIVAIMSTAYSVIASIGVVVALLSRHL